MQGTFLIDNPFHVAINKADYAAQELKDFLNSKKGGHRPVSLIGYGIGARVIVKALLDLYTLDSFGIILDVYLLGTFASLCDDDWIKLKKLCAGRVVNVYSTNDIFINVLNKLGYSFVGSRPVLVEGIHNLNVSDLIFSFGDYLPNLSFIMDRIKLDDD